MTFSHQALLTNCEHMFQKKKKGKEDVLADLYIAFWLHFFLSVPLHTDTKEMLVCIKYVTFGPLYQKEYEERAIMLFNRN